MKATLRHASHRRGGFTLIELLVVIAIIAILVSIAAPLVGRAAESARRAQARTELASIVTALQAYFNEYSRYPEGNGRPGDIQYLDGNDELLNVLRARDGDGNPNHERNPRRIVFLEIPNNSLSTTEANPDFVDPWSREGDYRPYRIAIDTDFNNDVETGDFGIVENKSVAAWSMGSDNDLSTAIKSWE
jgi:prepilin-type N-terminal cleavage/methylation domain-containing protein